MKQKHVSVSQKAKGHEVVHVLSSFCAFVRMFGGRIRDYPSINYRDGIRADPASVWLYGGQQEYR